MFHPLAPKRIASYVKNPKVIIILKNPIDRAYSQYLQLVSKQGYFLFNSLSLIPNNIACREKLHVETIIKQEFEEIEEIRKSFRECYNGPSCQFVDCIPHVNVSRHDSVQSQMTLESMKDVRSYLRQSLLFRSLYDDMVERWIDSVGSENIAVFFHEDFYYNPKQNMRQLFEFLGLDPPPAPVEDTWSFDKYDESELIWDPLNDHTHDALVDFMAPFNDRLFAMIHRADTDWKYHRTKIPK